MADIGSNANDFGTGETDTDTDTDTTDSFEQIAENPEELADDFAEAAGDETSTTTEGSTDGQSDVDTAVASDPLGGKQVTPEDGTTDESNAEEAVEDVAEDVVQETPDPPQETDPTDQPARGRGDTDSGPESTAPDEPQTPQGVPPDPEQGPSPDTESPGPGAPDFDQTESDTGDPTDLPARGRGDEDSGPESTAPDSNQTLTDPSGRNKETGQTGLGDGQSQGEDTDSDTIEIPEDGPDTSLTSPGSTKIDMTSAPGVQGAAEKTISSGQNPLTRIYGQLGGAIGGSPVGQAILGPPGREEQFLRGKAEMVAETSAGVADAANKKIVEPGSKYVGQGVAEINTLLTRPDLMQESVEEGELQTDEGVEGTATNITEGLGKGATDVIRSPQAGLTLANTAGSATNVALTNIKQEGVDEGIKQNMETGAAITGAAVSGLVEYAQNNPYELAGGIVGGYAAGAAIGRGVGMVGRTVRGRVRTAGGKYVEPEDITQRDVIEGDDDFPGAEDPDTYQTDPAEAVAEQARDYTPEEIQREYAQAGVDEGVTLKKAVDTEPEGPETGRAAQGLRVQEGSYESPGGFVGPELSPYFLGTETRAGYSLRPGLPDFGGKPTGAFIKTDVDSPDADTLAEFGDELRERAGETTAYTKPAGEVNTGEIEAVIPPEATFADVGSGPVRNTLRRLGIGSDYYTTYQGQRVPLRLVAPESDIDATEGLDVDVPRDVTGRVVRPRSSLYRSGRRATDRPLAVGPLPTTSTTTKTDGDGVGDTGSGRRIRAEDYQTDTRDIDGSGRRVTDGRDTDEPTSPRDTDSDPTRPSDTPDTTTTTDPSDIYDPTDVTPLSPPSTGTQTTSTTTDTDSTPTSIPGWPGSGTPTSPVDSGSGTPTDPTSQPPSGTPTEPTSQPPSGTPTDPTSTPPSGTPTGPSGIPPSSPPRSPPSEPGYGIPTSPPSSPGGSDGPSTPPTDPARTPGIDLGGDDDEEELFPGFGDRQPFGYDFLDPITGGVLKTDLLDGSNE